MTVTLNSPAYPVDYTGRNAANLVTNELQALTGGSGRNAYFAVPDFAPYFAKSMKVWFKTVGGEVRELHEGVDFFFTHYFIGASRACATPVYGSITFMNLTLIGTLIMQYQTVGGTWTQSSSAIALILADRLRNPRITAWEQVVDVPALFPVVDHEWNLVDLVGMKDVVLWLNKICDAIIANGNSITTQHLLDFNNPHHVTAAQLDVYLKAEVNNYLFLKQSRNERDQSGGYAGLTGMKLNMKNATNTITSFLSNINTAPREYVFPDKGGTIVLNSDITKSAIQTILGYVPTRQATFTGVAGEGYSVGALNDPAYWALPNPTTMGFAAGARFRFGFLNDVDASTGYADILDLSTWNASSGGGVNSLYFMKNAHGMVHKFANPGETTYRLRTVAYTDTDMAVSPTIQAALDKKENTSNKANNFLTVGIINDTYFPTTKAVNDWIKYWNFATTPTGWLSAKDVYGVGKAPYIPVHQSGFGAQGPNQIYIGWLNSQVGLGLGVDNTDFGNVWPIDVSGLAAKASTIRQSNSGQLMGFSFTEMFNQPVWLWGSDATGTAAYVYKPSNLQVGNASTVTTLNFNQVVAALGSRPLVSYPARNSTADLNSLSGPTAANASGHYAIGQNNPNSPASWGNLLQMNNEDVDTQLYMSGFDSMFWRQSINKTFGNAWRKVWDSVNLIPSVTPVANTAVMRDAQGRLGKTSILPSVGKIGSATGDQAGLTVFGNGDDAAFMTFYRQGAAPYASYLGLDIDNQWKVGGWSAGANSYALLHAGNFNNWVPTFNGTGANGLWNISVTGNAATVTTLTDTQIKAGLGFTPVQQGGGTGQSPNKIYIGYRTDGNLGLQVDVTNYGFNWPINVSGTAANAAKLLQGGTGAAMTFSWTDGGAMPNWIFGGNNADSGASIKVYNPATFSVAKSVLADTATFATKAGTVASGGTAGGTAIKFTWTSTAGQPTYLFGGNSADAVQLYNPSAFNVAWANACQQANVALSASYAVIVQGLGYTPIAPDSRPSLGKLTITSSYPTIDFADTTWGTRSILHTASNIGFLMSNGNWGAYCSNDGSWYAVGNVTAFSDERLKKDWKSFSNQLVYDLAKVKSGTYTRIDTHTRQAGVSAQSLQKVLNETVSEQEDGMLAVAYGNAALVGVIEVAKMTVSHEEQLTSLMEVVKALTQQVDELKQEVNSLKKGN